MNMNSYILNNNYMNGLGLNRMLTPRIADALVRDDTRERLHSINTNAYIWGEGFQVDPTQDYSNFTPKKIQ